MRNQFSLVVLILVSIVLRSTADEFYTGSSALNRKEKSAPEDKDTDDYIDYGDQMDDEYSGSVSARRNRNHGHGSSGNNGKSRPRWSSNDDESDYKHSDRHRQGGMGLDLSSLLQGFAPPNRFDNGPVCHSILDSQYPIFSDICGVMPQARYSLPNFFGHSEKWQIVQTLSVILGPSSSNDPACTRSLRLLVCPLIFPACKTRRDPLSILPCQAFCRGVKAQCPAPALEHLPCEYLAPTSDICPLNPLPYSSLLSSFSSPFPLGGPQGPSTFPPSALSSLLAQSAFGSGMPPSNLQSAFGAGFPPSNPQSPYGSGLSQSNIQSALASGLSPSNIQSALASGLSPAHLQSLFSGNGMTAQGFNGQQPFPSYLQSAGLQTPNFYGSQQGQQQFQQSNQRPSSFNAAKYASESLAPVLVDFPQLGGPGNDFRQGGRIFPSLRSGSEKSKN